MKIALRNGMAVIVGIIVGCIINMALVMAGPRVIPLPAGVDVSDAKSLAAHAHLLEPKHFVFPFLAHALGTLSGAFTCHLIAATHRSLFAYVIGGFFLAGGVAASFMIPAPAWFIAVDLVLAYIPMAWLGTRLGRGLRS
jgi:hypothetical protein